MVEEAKDLQIPFESPKVILCSPGVVDKVAKGKGEFVGALTGQIETVLPYRMNSADKNLKIPVEYQMFIEFFEQGRALSSELCKTLEGIGAAHKVFEKISNEDLLSLSILSKNSNLELVDFDPGGMCCWTWLIEFCIGCGAMVPQSILARKLVFDPGIDVSNLKNEVVVPMLEVGGFNPIAASRIKWDYVGMSNPEPVEGSDQHYSANEFSNVSVNFNPYECEYSDSLVVCSPSSTLNLDLEIKSLSKVLDSAEKLGIDTHASKVLEGMSESNFVLFGFSAELEHKELTGLYDTLFARESSPVLVFDPGGFCLLLVSKKCNADIWRLLKFGLIQMFTERGGLYG